MSKNNCKKVLNATNIYIFAIFVLVLGLLIYYRENYIFTIHDYLDSWPSLFEVLRTNKMFYEIDKPLPVLDGMSRMFLYFDYGAYTAINYIFGFIYGEIVNKTIGIIGGYISMKLLLSKIMPDNDNGHKKLIAAAYAITPVYPNWTISFAFLPLYFWLLWNYCEKDEFRYKARDYILAILFAFLVYFPTIGIFVFGIYILGWVYKIVKHTKIDKRFTLVIFIMFASIVIVNINVFFYVLKGIDTNRGLSSIQTYDSALDCVKSFCSIFKVAFFSGQYHAAPVLKIIIPLCLLLFMHSCIKKDKNLLEVRNQIILFALIVFDCLIYTLNEMDVFTFAFSYVFRMFKGFNFGRVLYFNNVLWLLLLAMQLRRIKKRVSCRVITSVLMLNLFLIIMGRGPYQDTFNNLIHEKSIDSGRVTYKEFFDTEYFTSIKRSICYQDEGVISVGYHPAVAMYNGFNTIDGYVCINPLTYHDKFRKIIEPSLEKSDYYKNYYDTWGGRAYVYALDHFDVDPTREYDDTSIYLYIDTQELKGMNGQYILSKWEIENSSEIDISLIKRFNSNNGIYSIWVYRVNE